MKKITMYLLIVGALTTKASAHHMTNSDVAGLEIVDWRPHLDMEF